MPLMLYDGCHLQWGTDGTEIECGKAVGGTPRRGKLPHLPSNPPRIATVVMKDEYWPESCSLLIPEVGFDCVPGAQGFHIYDTANDSRNHHYGQIPF